MSKAVAQRIYQQNLDAVSAALMAGDLQEMLKHIAIPNMMATRDSEIVMASPEELDMVMQDFRAQLLARGVTSYRRTCLEAEFVTGSGDMISGRHRTDAFGHDGARITPYMNYSVLILMDGRWKGVWLQAVLENTELEVLSPDIAAAQARARLILESADR